MTATILLAQGDLADLPAVLAVMTDAFDPCFGEAWTHAQCAGLLPMPGVWLTLAHDGDSGVVGFSLARVILDEAELLLLAVRRDARRRGVGLRLLDHFNDSAHVRGALRLHLEVRDGNPAVQLYDSSGFTLVGRRPNYYRGHDDRQYDALSLSRPTSATQKW